VASDAEYSPGTQETHGVAALASSSAVPASHAAHGLVDDGDANPAGHGVHDVAPRSASVSVTLPAGQARQAVAEIESWSYSPTGQPNVQPDRAKVAGSAGSMMSTDSDL
jgi:hypothetical protein